MTKTLDGLDSFLSIVQMPAGVPVATVPIDGAAAAGMLAAKILGVGNPEMQKKLSGHVQSALESEAVRHWLDTIVDRHSENHIS